ncbi:MAG: hypothetical protein SOW59_04960 [Corynebacterium sp.]|nr:hypothetical protein [Corynebacterium sp.]
MAFGLELFGDAGQGAAVEVEGVDVAYELGLHLVDDEKEIVELLFTLYREAVGA